MPERTVAFVFYSYKQEGKNGQTIKTAVRGETINLSAEEAERGDALGAFGNPKVATADTTVEPLEQPAGVASASDDELDKFVKSHNATEVTAAAAGDKQQAARLLAAEQRQTKPRKTVLAALGSPE